MRDTMTTATIFFDSLIGDPDTSGIKNALKALEQNNIVCILEYKLEELALIRDVERKHRIQDARNFRNGKDKYTHFPQFIVVKRDDAEQIAQALDAVSFMEYYFNELVPDMEVFGELSEGEIYVRWKLRYCPSYQVERPISFYDNENGEPGFSLNNDEGGEVKEDEGEYHEAIWTLKSAIKRLS